MRVLQVFNRRNDWGGEDLSIDDTITILQNEGHAVEFWVRDLCHCKARVRLKAMAFFSGIYSIASARRARELITQRRPDVVHAHNLYPLLSPSVLREFSRNGVATVWHPHDQRPMCATGLSLYRGAICEQCAGTRDYWCILRNCRGNLAESVAYAVRNTIHRRLRVYQRYAHVTIVWSQFLRQRLLQEGFPPDRTFVVPHPVSFPEKTADPRDGSYVAYLGRLSAEKGIRVLLDAAARVPHIPFRVAGDPKGLNGDVGKVPANVRFVGWLDRMKVPEFLRGARFTVLPSVCFETFPTAALEAMSHGIPVVGARIGGIPEAVLEGRTGVLFDAGDDEQLAQRITALWNTHELCRHLGAEARDMVAEKYSTKAYFESLMHAYQLALRIAQK